jgi:pyruvate formate lyase activating enzyme
MSAYRALPLSRSEGRSLSAKPEQADMVGYLHSVETFGTLDGPGIRYVLFFQGCHLKCLFCQNRDTWERRPGRIVAVPELMCEFKRYKTYMTSSGGGITASGGDPILQPDFVAALFAAARRAGIHTALDTSGVTRITPAVKALLAETDLVLLDIKHIDREAHRVLTGHSNERVIAFARHLEEIRKPTWIRHVIVPGFTDTDDSAKRTAAFVRELDNVERVELLPYHEYGIHKWDAVGESYPLEGVEPPTTERMNELRDVFRRGGAPVAG